MKRYSCHFLYVPERECLSGQIVTLMPGGQVRDYVSLQEEVCGTQWIGGVILLSPFASLEIERGETFNAFRQRVVLAGHGPLYAWHVLDLDLIHRSFTANSRLVRLEG